MTIGEKLSEHYPCRQKDFVYEFNYVVEGANGIMESKPFKGRLGNEFVTAEDGKDYVFGVPLKGRNIGFCKVINDIVLKNAKFDVIKQETYYVFCAVLVRIAVTQCMMLSPIHIYTDYTGDGFLHIYGEARIDLKDLRPIDRLKYSV